MRSLHECFGSTLAACVWRNEQIIEQPARFERKAGEGRIELRKPNGSAIKLRKENYRFIVVQPGAEKLPNSGWFGVALIKIEIAKKQRNEFIEVVDVDAVKVDLIKDGDNDVLDISVALPEKNPGTA